MSDALEGGKGGVALSLLAFFRGSPYASGGLSRRVGKYSLKAFSDIAARLAPGDAEAVRMLKDLVAAFGVNGAAVVCGVSVTHVKKAMYGRETQGLTVWARRAIWLTWALLVHPERAETLLDLVTWGRLCEPIEAPLPPAKKVYAVCREWGRGGPRRVRELKRRHREAQSGKTVPK